MRRRLAALVLLAAAASAAETTIPVTRDARLYLHPSEADRNGGVATRLRARALTSEACELIILDVDHAALASFLDAHRGATAQLRLWVREIVGGGSGRLEAAALDTPTDWNEGTHDAVPAVAGEVCGLSAQAEVAPWMTVDGKTVHDARGLFFDRAANRVTTLANAQPLALQAADVEHAVAWPLDAALVDHLAHERLCRGLVLFTRDPAMLDVYSREQTGKEPALVLTSP